MTDTDKLDLILSELQGVKEKLSTVETKVDTLETKVDNIDKKVDTLETKVDTLETKVGIIDKKVDILETKVDQNYDTTLEFYVNQKEHNTEVSKVLDIITGELDMHNNQIAMNTAVLKRYK